MFLRSLKEGVVIAGKVLGTGAAVTTSVGCTTLIATSVNSYDNKFNNNGLFKTAQPLTNEHKPKETITSKFKL